MNIQNAASYRNICAELLQHFSFSHDEYARMIANELLNIVKEKPFSCSPNMKQTFSFLNSLGRRRRKIPQRDSLGSNLIFCSVIKYSSTSRAMKILLDFHHFNSAHLSFTKYSFSAPMSSLSMVAVDKVAFCYRSLPRSHCTNFCDLIISRALIYILFRSICHPRHLARGVPWLHGYRELSKLKWHKFSIISKLPRERKTLDNVYRRFSLLLLFYSQSSLLSS